MGIGSRGKAGVEIVMAGDKGERCSALDADALSRYRRHIPAISDDAPTR